MAADERKAKFAVCLNNTGYPASLEVGRLYQIVADQEALDEGYIRVVDESGDDYGFEANRFYLVELPDEAARALIKARKSGSLGLAS